MFGLLKVKNSCEQEAAQAYASMLERVREPLFYEGYGVPDTFDGRFDLLVVHAALIMEVLAGEGRAGQEFNQALFDVMFADMDQALRQMGAGDVSVPKHMRRMMKGFNGRVQAYEAARDDKALEGVLIRNLYGTATNPDLDSVRAMKSYIARCRENIARQSLEDLLAGHVAFEKL